VKSYFVTWEIDIDADSPRQAAQKAWDIVRAPGSMANVFDVIECDIDGVPTRVDLSEESPIEMEDEE
jgi:hypothetical protein